MLQYSLDVLVLTNVLCQNDFLNWCRHLLMLFDGMLKTARYGVRAGNLDLESCVDSLVLIQAECSWSAGHTSAPFLKLALPVHAISPSTSALKPRRVVQESQNACGRMYGVAYRLCSWNSELACAMTMYPPVMVHESIIGKFAEQCVEGTEAGELLAWQTPESAENNGSPDQALATVSFDGDPCSNQQYTFLSTGFVSLWRLPVVKVRPTTSLLSFC